MEIHADNRKRAGIFQAASTARRHSRGDRQLVEETDAAVDWCIENPIACRRRAGLIVERQIVLKPGTILYEIAVEPWKDADVP